MLRKKGNIMQSNTQNVQAYIVQAYIVQSIKELTNLLDDQAPNLQTANCTRYHQDLPRAAKSSCKYNKLQRN